MFFTRYIINNHSEVSRGMFFKVLVNLKRNKEKNLSDCATEFAYRHELECLFGFGMCEVETMLIHALKLTTTFRLKFLSQWLGHALCKSMPSDGHWLKFVP